MAGRTLLYSLLLASACSIGAAQESCGDVLEEYDTSTLARAAAWYTSHDCMGPVGEIGGKCDYYFAFGHPLTTIDGCQNASACVKYDNTTTVIIGTYDKQVDEFCLSNEQAYSFVGILSDGEEFNTSQGLTNLSMVVKFKCNLVEFWYPSSSNESPVTEKAIENFEFKDGTGRYVVEVTYSGACIEVSPVELPAGISAGSVLLIVLVCIVAAYLIVGSIINYSSGKQGVEILPNASIWSQLPTDVKAGFAFSLGCFKSASGSQAASVPDVSTSDTSAFAKDTKYGAI